VSGKLRTVVPFGSIIRKLILREFGENVPCTVSPEPRLRSFEKDSLAVSGVTKFEEYGRGPMK
jgi:hypothetical protein